VRKEIRIYVEGGGRGESRHTNAQFRAAFGDFLSELRDCARAQRIGWKIIACGSRSSAFDDYQTALRAHPHSFNVLLVDSERAVTVDNPWRHLKAHSGDNWDNPGVDDRHCHLMVQTTEAWLIADREKLREYYGRDFHENSLPRNPNVEAVPKDVLERALRDATRNTQKGPYHKGKHAPAILRIVRPSEVKRKAPHCKRLFETLAAEIARIHEE